MKATEQCFFVILMITLYKVVLTFESGYNPKKRPLKWTLLSSPFLWSCSLCYAMCSVDEILVSVSIQMKAIELYFLVVRQYAVQGGSTFRVVNGIPKLYDHSNESYWAVLSCSTAFCCARWFYLLSLCRGILKCNNSNETYWTVLSCCTVYYAVQGGSNFWVCEWNP